MFKRILVPLDGSTASFNAFDWALEIALGEQSQALLTALCVIDVRVSHEAQVYLPRQDEIAVSYEIVTPAEAASTYQAWAQKIIDYARKRSAAVHLEIQPEIVSGIPYEEIISRSAEHELLVLGGWQMSSDYPGPFLGGNTFWHVAIHTKLPTFFVSTPLRKIETILVVYDDTLEAQHALQLASTWAKVWKLKLIALVMGQPDEERAQTWLQQADSAALQLITRAGEGFEVIQEVAAQFHCDLISLGVQSHHLWPGHSLGAVTDKLLRSGNIPLLLSH